VAGEIGLAQLTIFYGAIRGTGSMFTGSAGGTADDYRLEFGTAAVPAVLELERLTADGHSGAAPPVAPATRGATPAHSDGPSGIRLEGVTFRYPGSERDTLAGIDLDIPVGQSLAIVGANGAGKTTLVKLLCRLYEPTSGQITVDGVDLAAIDARAWQRQVAAIFQDFVQYPLSACDNVGFGAVHCANDVERLAAAARRAGALDIVESLPRGWDMVLSREFTGGTQLSGGQWQRIALARALFAAGSGGRASGGDVGARLLILDEPTAALDVRAEAELYDRFLDLTQGLTTILISHRFSTVRRADRIVVIEHGRVLEQGNHDELVALGGRYAEMFALQASRFTGAADAPPGRTVSVGGAGANG
jgi:ATP-binding cassette subfamily B protein